MTFKNAAAAGGVHEDTLDNWRKRGATEKDTAYSRFIGQTRQGSRKRPQSTTWRRFASRSWKARKRVRTHIKKDESGKVILTEIHRETLPPDIKGAMWWLERRFPEQFGRRDQMEHSGGGQGPRPRRPRKLTIDLVKSDGTVHRVSRGMSYKDAAMAGGIHEETLAVWRKRGAAEKETRLIPGL